MQCIVYRRLGLVKYNIVSYLIGLIDNVHGAVDM